jgi:cobalt-zinc-cadmium efflux system membrane fusion protein
MSKKGVLFLLFLAASGLQCNRSGVPVPTSHQHPPVEPSQAKGVVRLPAATIEAVGIKLEEVQLREFRPVLKAMGKVLAPQRQTAIVSHVFPARVGDVHIKIGDWVKKGQALVTLESQEVGSAKSEFYKALAACELARLSFDREERLLGNGIGIKKNFLAAETEYKIAQANAEAAHKKLHVLGFTDEQLKEIAETHQVNPTITLFSPIAGRVVANKAILGALVDQSTEIMTIIDPTLLWVDGEIYEKDIAKVEIGQEVEVAVLAYPGEVFRGKVNYIGDLVSEETRTITVRAEVANDQHRLKPGMFADIRILLDGGQQRLAIPLAAVLEEGRQKIVFVQEGDCFVCREVEMGIANGDYQQVVKGLRTGEKVVIEGNHQLKSELQKEVLKAAEVH